MNATNSSQDWVGGGVGLFLSHLIYINNTLPPFSDSGFLTPQSKICSKKLSNLHLTFKKSYKQNCSPAPPTTHALKQPWPYPQLSLAPLWLALISPLSLPPSPLVHSRQQWQCISFSPAPHITSLSPAYIHGVNSSGNVCAEALCVQIRNKPAVLPKPVNPHAW